MFIVIKIKCFNVPFIKISTKNMGDVEFDDDAFLVAVLNIEKSLNQDENAHLSRYFSFY